MLSLAKYSDSIVAQLKPPRPRRYGTLTRIVGLTLQAKSVSAAVGSICRILRSDGEHVDAQVVGFESGSVYLMPLWQATGLSAGCRVYVHKETDTALVGDGLLGRMVDAMGEPFRRAAEDYRRPTHGVIWQYAESNGTYTPLTKCWMSAYAP